MWNGYDHSNVRELHDQYGPVVRTAPNTLTFVSAQAWQDIYGFPKGRPQIPKDLTWYLPEGSNVPRALINADDADHARMRRLVAHAFSNTALHEQEQILTKYFDLLVQRLREKGKVDLAQHFHFLTFDIIGDLALGQSFGMLEETSPPSRLEGLAGASAHLIHLWSGQIVPLYGALLRLHAKLPGSSDARRRMNDFARSCAKERMQIKTDRKDFMTYILRHNDERGMSNQEIGMTAKTFINAGSETTATTMTWVHWHLLQHDKVRERAIAEVRSRFSDASELNLQSTSQANLPYLYAVIQETLRMTPAANPTAFPRKPTETMNIDGEIVPAGTRIGVPQYASFHSAMNFRDPDVFVPERWLGDPVYQDDKRDAFNPFLTGPRGCLGKNLAWAELLSVTARLLFHFDMELCAESKGWGVNQKTQVFWSQPPLLVNLTPAGRSTRKME